MLKSKKFNISDLAAQEPAVTIYHVYRWKEQAVVHAHTGIPMSCVERMRLCRRSLQTCSVTNNASTVTTAVPKSMDIVSVDETQTSIEDDSELMDINISRIVAIQDH